MRAFLFLSNFNSCILLLFFLTLKIMLSNFIFFSAAPRYLSLCSSSEQRLRIRHFFLLSELLTVLHFSLCPGTIGLFSLKIGATLKDLSLLPVIRASDGSAAPRYLSLCSSSELLSRICHFFLLSMLLEVSAAPRYLSLCSSSELLLRICHS